MPLPSPLVLPACLPSLPSGVSALDVLSSSTTSSSPSSSSSSSLLSMGAFLAVFAAYVGAVMFPWISFMIHRNPLVW